MDREYVEQLPEETSQRIDYEDIWGDVEKTRQNEEMKKLYRNYIELQNKIPEN